MENNDKILAMMERMEKTGRRQLLFTKVLCVLTALVLVFFLVLVGFLSSASGYIQELAVQIDQIADQAVTVLDNLETVTNELAQVDLNGMVSDVDALVGSSQSAVEKALEKLNTVDIETLNRAIADLAAVVEPLAKITNMW